MLLGKCSLSWMFEWTRKKHNRPKHNGRKRPQINKHEFHFSFLSFFRFLPPPASLYACICPHIVGFLSLGGGFMNKYSLNRVVWDRKYVSMPVWSESRHHRRMGRRKYVREMIWKIRWMKSSELGPTDMIGIIKNNFLEAISLITMKLYWMNFSFLSDWPRMLWQDVRKEVRSIWVEKKLLFSSSIKTVDLWNSGESYSDVYDFHVTKSSRGERATQRSEFGIISRLTREKTSLTYRKHRRNALHFNIIQTDS